MERKNKIAKGREPQQVPGKDVAKNNINMVVSLILKKKFSTSSLYFFHFYRFYH